MLQLRCYPPGGAQQLSSEFGAQISAGVTQPGRISSKNSAMRKAESRTEFELMRFLVQPQLWFSSVIRSAGHHTCGNEWQLDG